MNAPLTAQNHAAWMAMVDGGMNLSVAMYRMSQWAAMLETRLSELDPQYQSHPWGASFAASHEPNQGEKHG